MNNPQLWKHHKTTYFVTKAFKVLVRDKAPSFHPFPLLLCVCVGERFFQGYDWKRGMAYLARVALHAPLLIGWSLTSLAALKDTLRRCLGDDFCFSDGRCANPPLHALFTIVMYWEVLHDQHIKEVDFAKAQRCFKYI